MSRGNNKMTIYRDDRDYGRFFAILADVLQEYEVDCWVHCAMPNHYHLVWRTRQANLSKAMRQLNGVYAQWWNRRHGRVGHVFQGRFKAQIVEDSLYLLRLCRYVLLNPIRAGLASTLGEWQWSSYRALIGDGADSTFLDVDSLLSRFGDPAIDNVRARLIEFVSEPLDSEMAAWIRGDRRVIGCEAFIARFRQKALSASEEVPSPERHLASPSLATILTSSLRRSGGLNTGIVRAHSDHAYSVAEIARCTGLSTSTISRILRRQLPGANVTALD
jgi:REP-associated tyrosine transposase